MEFLLLYWDNLDDLAGAAALKTEILRKFLLRFLLWGGSLCLAVGAALMAVTEPVFGLASATLLFVLLFYRRVTNPRFESQPA